MTLAGQLRLETRALHARTERTLFMSRLLGAQLGMHEYCLLLRNLHPIYQSMEIALQAHAGHPMVRPLFASTLFRTDALATDLADLHGCNWAQELPMAPISLTYVQRLQALDRGQPELLAAHAYVRYLGDLNGGQALKSIVARSLGLKDGRGTRFYEFGLPDEVARLTQAFRAGLDALPVDPPTVRALLSEATHSFELHCTLFDQLSHGASAAPPSVCVNP